MSANESRRRAEPVSSQETASKTTATKFAYQPLDPNVDCTRFVKIQPAGHDDDPVACSLIHRPFGERPKFEALSYMWGDATAKQSIQLDGCNFDIGKNLFEALRYIRSTQSEGDLFWIDALCINQADTDERNRQVRMMGQIYFRAKQVTVWLGVKYLKYQKRIPGLFPRHASIPQVAKPENTPSEKGPQAHASDAEEAMVDDLVDDEYWNRLWIIQEIGQNETKRVCFGNMAMTWADFIQMVTMHSDRNAVGPQRLDRQVKEKYAGSHTLRRLLIDHQHAQCKDRKDKIYGLVGLAVDGRGFPMDYEKSEMEIWTDTMEFMNRQRLFDAGSDDDIIAIGSLIKYLLMGQNSSPLQQVWRSYKARADTRLILEPEARSYNNPSVFLVNAYVVGIICSRGPSTREIVSDMSKTNDWGELIQTKFQDNLGAASEENNNLLRAILESEDDELAGKCINHVGLVKWRAYYLGLENGYSGYQKKRFEVVFPAPCAEGDPSAELSLAHHEQPHHSQRHTTDKRDNSGNAYLFLLHGTHSGSATRWKMGIVCGQAVEGDLICWIRGTRRAIVVRMYGKHGLSEHMLQICGTALFGEDLTEPLTDHSARCDQVPGRCDTKLKLDPRSIFILLP